MDLDPDSSALTLLRNHCSSVLCWRLHPSTHGGRCAAPQMFPFTVQPICSDFASK